MGEYPGFADYIVCTMNRLVRRNIAGLKPSARGAFLQDIRTRLTVAIVLVTLCVSLLGLIFNLAHDAYRIRQSTVEANLVRLKALRIDFVKVIAGYSPDAAAELVDRLSSFSDIRNLLLHDNDGRHVFRYDRERADVLDLHSLVNFSDSSAIVHSSDGLLLHHTVTYEGNRNGWVTIRVSTAELQDRLKAYSITVLLLVIGTAIIAIVLSVLVGHYFTKPIRSLAAFTRRVSESRDFDQRVHTREGGDVGDLYNGINAMLKEISAAEREIHRLNESRMRGLIESSLDGAITMSADGLITYWGKQNIKIFGWLEDEALGQPLEDLIIPERFRKQHREGLQRFLSSGEASIIGQRLEVSGLHRGGHEVPIELSLSANREKQGWVFNAFIRDLTEIRETEQGLRDAQSQLLSRERLAAVGQLTATVAHELRNPIGTISNSIYTLNRKLGDQDSEIAGLVERVERNVQRCNLIISELLNFTRDRKLTLQPIPIDDWLGRLLDGYECPEQVELLRTLSSGEVVPVDVAYFESAIVNVLDNAVHAVLEQYPEGGGRIEVEVVAEDGRIAVVVSDNGPGVAARDIEQVMEPLYSSKVYGVGLGLPTAKKIMEKHGGELIMEANDGGGARVYLWLSAEQVPEGKTVYLTMRQKFIP